MGDSPTRRNLYRCPHVPCAYRSGSKFRVKNHIKRCGLGREVDELGNVVPSNHGPTIVAYHGDHPSSSGDQNVLTDSGVEGRGEQTHVDTPPYVVEICQIMTACSGKGCTAEMSRIIKIITGGTFEKEEFAQHVKSIASCKAIENKHEEHVLEEEGFARVAVPGDKGDEVQPCFMYVKDIVSVLRKQVQVCDDKEFIFFPQKKGNDSIPHPMFTTYIRELTASVRHSVMVSTDPRVSWTEEVHDAPVSFCGIVQVYSDKTATTLKANALVAYPLHAVFMNTTKTARRFLINAGHTLVGFLPVGCDSSSAVEGEMDELQGAPDLDLLSLNTVPLADYVQHTSTMSGRKRKMHTLHHAFLKIFEPLAKVCYLGMEVCTKSKVRRKCFPIIASYCCDIPEGKDASGVQHGTKVKCPCVRCLVPGMDSSGKYPPRLMSGTLNARAAVDNCNQQLRTVCNNDRALRKVIGEQSRAILKELSLSPWPSMLESLCMEPRVCPPEVYQVFTFEPLHNLHLGISKLLKNCLLSYLSSEYVTAFPNLPLCRQRRAPSMKNSILRGCNAMLAEIQRSYPLRGHNVCFAKKESSSVLNGLFTKDGIRGMLEGADYRSVDLIFPFVAAFVDRCLGRIEEHEQTTVHTMYTDLMVEVGGGGQAGNPSGKVHFDIEQAVLALKRSTVNVFKEHCSKGLFTLKFHLLDHIHEDIDRYGSLEYIDASAFEQFNVNIKKSFRTTSMRQATRMQETVRNMEPVLKRTRRNMDHRAHGREVGRNWPVHTSEGRNYLVRDGHICTVMELEGIANGDSRILDLMSDELKRLLRTLRETSLKTLVNLVKEYIHEDGNPTVVRTANITIVPSGQVRGGFIPDLTDYNEEKNVIETTRADNCNLKTGWQRIFATDRFGSHRKAKHSVVLLRAGGQDAVNEFWVAKVLLLFRLTTGTDRSGEELAFVQYLECTPPADAIDRELGCICLRWANAYAGDDINAESLQNAPHYGAEWFGLEPLQAIQGSIHILRSNMAIHPHTVELPWTRYRFYVNRFYREMNSTTCGEGKVQRNDDGTSSSMSESEEAPCLMSPGRT